MPARKLIRMRCSRREFKQWVILDYLLEASGPSRLKFDAAGFLQTPGGSRIQIVRCHVGDHPYYRGCVGWRVESVYT